MSFGRREAVPTFLKPPTSAQDVSTSVTRPGGYWLGLLAVPLVSVACLIVMALLPLTNPTGAPLERILILMPAALISVTMMSALFMLGADLLLRSMGARKPWIYALVCGSFVYVGTFLLMTLAGKGMSLLFLLGMCFIPATVGGWIMGLVRR